LASLPLLERFETMARWVRAFEAVRKSTIAWINVCAFFETAAPRLPQDEGFSQRIKGLPHAEERQKDASRSTHCLASALLSLCKSISLTASFAGKTGKFAPITTLFYFITSPF
jgi:hypothetical protein